MSDQIISQIGHELRAAGSVAIVSHIRPDGDAVGSVLGLGLSLKAAGKQAQMVLADGVPSKLRYLRGSDLIERRILPQPDLIVSLDASDLKRLGDAIGVSGPPQINIDHHITNENYARLNLVDLDAASTAEIVAQCLQPWDLPVNLEVAEALLTGIVTDTLGFKTSSVTPHTLRIAAQLMEIGANVTEIYRQALEMRSYQALQFWGYGLNRIERVNGLIWTSLTMEDRGQANYPGRDDADLINVLSSVEDANIAIIFVEQSQDRVKVSWRAKPGFDVSGIATSFGGGGHPAASGADIAGSLEEVRSRVVSDTLSNMQVSEPT